jgi:hypothetical protein
MRSIPAILFAAGLVASSAMPGFAACTDTAAVAKTRADAETACEMEGHGCTTAQNHGQYVSCIAKKTNDAVVAQTLPKECKGAVKRCAAKSTCGKAGFVTCCRTKPRPGGGTATKCSIKKDAAHCTAPTGGTACPGTHSSCCDACTDTGCASPSGAFVR